MTTEMSAPSFSDVFRARQVIQVHLPRTPLHRYPALDHLLNARVYVKHENYQPIGAFKIRGGIYFIARCCHGSVKRRNSGGGERGNR